MIKGNGGNMKKARNGGECCELPRVIVCRILLTIAGIGGFELSEYLARTVSEYFFIGYYNLIECSFIKTPHYHSKFMVIPPRGMLLIYCREACFTVSFSNKSYPLAVVRFRIWGGRNCP